MLSRYQNERQGQTKQRPYSAASARSHSKSFRLTDNQTLNTLRNNINVTFSNQNRYLKQVRSLTSKIDKKYQKRINRLCVQFSICQNPGRQKNVFQDIDVQFITKKYIVNKSKQKKKQLEREQLKKDISKISQRYIKREPKQFFKFDIDTLREMQQKAKITHSNRKASHPYLTLYEESQVQALNCLTERNQLNLGEANSYPAIGQPQDWQKQQKQIKKIYQGVRTLRRQKCRESMSHRQSQERDHFYIT